MRIFSLLLGTVFLWTAAGCGSSSEGSVRSADTEEQEETTQEPADLIYASLGEEVTYSGVSATLDHAYLSDYVFTDNDQEVTIIFYQITLTNNTEEDLCANYLSDTFYSIADGAGYMTTTLRAARFITLQFGEDSEYFTEDIAPGETRQGYVYTEVPADFEEAGLICYPAAGIGDRGTAYGFTFARDELETAPEPVTPYGNSEDASEDTAESDDDTSAEDAVES